MTLIESMNNGARRNEISFGVGMLQEEFMRVGAGDGYRREDIIMALMRWRPRGELDLFRDFGRMQDEVNRLFDSVLGGWPAERRSLLEGNWAPAMDVEEDKDKLTVKADLPGMTEKDIDVSILGDTLTIKGERKKEEEKKEKNYHRIERSYGMFQRSIPLPGSVVSDKVKASFKDGVLQIEMPKKEEAKAKQVKIEVGK